QLSRLIVQIDGEAIESADLREAVADYAVEQVGIDIAAADDHDDALATKFVSDFQRARESGGASALGEQLHPFENQQDRGTDLKIIDGDDALYALTNYRERDRTDATGRETI